MVSVGNKKNHGLSGGKEPCAGIVIEGGVFVGEVFVNSS